MAEEKSGPARPMVKKKGARASAILAGFGGPLFLAFCDLGKDPTWMPFGHPFLHHIIHHSFHFHRPESCNSRAKGNYTRTGSRRRLLWKADFRELRLFILWVPLRAKTVFRTQKDLKHWSDDSFWTASSIPLTLLSGFTHEI